MHAAKNSKCYNNKMIPKKSSVGELWRAEEILQCVFGPV